MTTAPSALEIDYTGPEREEPFCPAGADFKGISPTLAKVRATGIAIRALIVVPVATSITYFAASEIAHDNAVASWLPYLVGGLLLAYYLWWGWIRVRQVHAFAYARTESELLIRRGIMFRSLTLIPYGRLQYVDVAEGPIERHFGLASVSLYTASGASDATIPGLPTKEAARLRDELAARGEAELAGL
ncbi:MAG: PH domain-containing protein [Actinomycetaceae bacterium]|nr:PH domain-containing protein [Actinomycetaceae bacterium]